jgi:hypothetical protein
MLIKPRGCTFNDDGSLPNAAANINGPAADPLCHVKNVQTLASTTGHEDYKTEMGKWYESRREFPLCSLFEFDNPQAQKWQQE